MLVELQGFLILLLIGSGLLLRGYELRIVIEIAAYRIRAKICISFGEQNMLMPHCIYDRWWRDMKVCYDAQKNKFLVLFDSQFGKIDLPVMLPAQLISKCSCSGLCTSKKFNNLIP